MNLNDEFELIIKDLRAGKRPRKKWSEDQWEFILTTWQAELKTRPDESTLMKVFCLVEHATAPYPEDCQELVIAGFSSQNLTPNSLITLIGISQKVIFAQNYKRGLKVPRKVYDLLKERLEHSLSAGHQEVTEWILRTLMEAGNEASYLLPDIQKIKVGWFKKFNKTNKEIDQLRQSLIERWENLPQIPM